MWLTTEERSAMEAHAKAVGALDRDAQLVGIHATLGPEASREAALAEIRRTIEAVARADIPPPHGQDRMEQ